MRIGEVTYEEFGPFETATLDFSSPGVTVVEGRIEKVRGCDSNGSGKSFTIDGVAWVLYDRCIREKYKGDDVIRNGSTKGCRVTVNIIDGPEPIVIRRHRKWMGLLEDGKTKAGDRVQVWVGGKETTRGNNPMTEAYIANELLGMDFTTFVNAVAFGSREDVKGFFTATDADRKAVLENILGLTLYASAEALARKRAKTGAMKLGELDLSIGTLRKKAEDNREIADRFGGSDEIRDVEMELSHLKLRYKQVKSVSDKAAEDVTEAKSKASLAQALYDAKQKDYDKAKQARDAKVKALNAEKQKALQEASKLDGVAYATNESAKKLASLGKECPTCRQPVSKAHVAAVDGELKKAFETYSFEADAFRLEADHKQKEIDAVPSIDPLDQAAKIAANAAVTQRQSDLNIALARTSEVNKQLTQKTADYTQHAEKVAALIAEADASDVKANASQVERDALDLSVARCEFWVSGFGNSGLKSFLLEAELPWINNRATARARQLLGEGAIVRLSATKSLKTKDEKREEMTIEGSVPGMTRSYAGASKGQKRRMDLALLLAFRDLSASRSGNVIDQLIVDEIFDGMDRTGTESVADMLAELSAERPVLLVTHDDRLKSVGERTVIIHHDGNPEGGKATIEVLGGLKATKSSVADTMGKPQAKVSVKKPALKKKGSV